MPTIASTSGRLLLHSEFVRLLFLHTHRETDRFYAASGVQLVRHFFFRGVWLGTPNLKGCVFVYVPRIAVRKIAVKGELVRVGGGGEECLKTYKSVRTGDGVVL
jgi:hypothetical protein